MKNIITVIEMDYLTDSEIQDVIRNLAKANGKIIPERLIKEYANAFKGLSEFEIQNIMQLILSQNEDITKSQINLVLSRSSR